MENNCLFNLTMSLLEKINKIRQLEKGKWVALLLHNGSNIKGKIHEVNGRIYLKTFSFRKGKEGRRKVKASGNISAVEFADVKQVGVDSGKYKTDYQCFYRSALRN